MSFWSGETLKKRLPTLIQEFDSNKIDCSAYTLTVGPEVYVTPDHEIPTPSTHTRKTLDNGESFTIPSGQFGFILTEEKIKVPDDAMAFISIKAKTKFKGLINASGFHVDPGYEGRLIFSVFNAGPNSIHLERGMPLFLIWYANLDQTTAVVRTAPCYNNIPPDLINSISGEIHSIRSLSDKIRDIEKEFIGKLHTLQVRVAVISVVFLLLLTFLAYGLREPILNSIFGTIINEETSAPQGSNRKNSAATQENQNPNKNQ